MNQIKIFYNYFVVLTYEQVVPSWFSKCVQKATND